MGGCTAHGLTDGKQVGKHGAVFAAHSRAHVHINSGIGQQRDAVVLHRIERGLGNRGWQEFAAEVRIGSVGYGVVVLFNRVH